MNEVVRIAMIVPMGMDLWASRRSPDLFEPAIIPERQTDRGYSIAESILFYNIRIVLQVSFCMTIIIIMGG